MLIAREGEEIVCPKGTVCGRLTRDANDQIIDGDFTARESSSSHADQRYVCACCGGLWRCASRFAGEFISAGGGCDNAATRPDAFCDQGFSNADIGV